MCKQCNSCVQVVHLCCAAYTQSCSQHSPASLEMHAVNWRYMKLIDNRLSQSRLCCSRNVLWLSTVSQAGALTSYRP